MLQNLEEIELVMKDIYEKGFCFKNMKNFFQLENGEGEDHKEGKKHTIKFLTENLRKSINSLSCSEKINLILDIDETLVYTKKERELQENEDLNKIKIMEELQKNSKTDQYYISFNSNKKDVIYKVQVRKNMAYFFKKLSAYCNFYINTMASPIYVKEIITLLHKNYGLRFTNINETNIFYTSPQQRKILPKEIIKNENFLILDDNICAWDIAYIPSIIPIRKFCDEYDVNETKNVFYQYYLFSNKIYCFDEITRPFLDCDKIPYCVETEKNESSQLYYISDMIIKSFTLSRILGIPIRHSLHFFQNTILKNCSIYYNGYDSTFVSEMINLLGGTVVNDIKEATHIVSNKNFIKDEDEIREKQVLDIKWVFDCFFNLKKCDEHKDEYQQ